MNNYIKVIEVKKNTVLLPKTRPLLDLLHLSANLNLPEGCTDIMFYSDLYTVSSFLFFSGLALSFLLAANLSLVPPGPSFNILRSDLTLALPLLFSQSYPALILHLDLGSPSISNMSLKISPLWNGHDIYSGLTLLP